MDLLFALGLAVRIPPASSDDDRAEDALQDALVIAWRDLRGLRELDRFHLWLRRLLVNVASARRRASVAAR